MINLRDYQLAAVRSIWNYFQMGHDGNPIVAMPTGTGKSFTMAEFDRQVLEAFPGQRILNLTHVKELIEGNHKALMTLNPMAPAGVYSAGLKKKQVAPITFAGIMSVKNKPELFAGVNLIKVDECHLISEKESTTYRVFIDELRKYNPKLKVIGFSATPFRMKTGMLTERNEQTGEPVGLFTDICCDMATGDAFVWFLDQGYLAPLIPYRSQTQMDLTDVHVRGGDYIETEVEAAIDAQGVIKRAIDETLQWAQDRRKWIVFAASIKHCEEIADYLTSRGILSAAVHSNLPAGERDKRIAAFKAGKLKCLVNKNILTTGFDEPGIDLIVYLRPTRSPGLHVQMCGRGTRPVYAPGFNLQTQEGRLNAIYAGPKQNCLVLDFAGNTETLGPINYPTIPDPKRKRKRGNGEAPSKVCPDCALIVHATVRQCPQCGHEFQFEDKTAIHASTAELISRAKPESEEIAKITEVFAVTRMSAMIHNKAGKPPSMRVDYYCGTRRFTTFVCPEHSGGAKYLARKWWTAHAKALKIPMPNTAEEMLRLFEFIRRPETLTVWLNTKYPEVIAYDENESSPSRNDDFPVIE